MEDEDAETREVESVDLMATRVDGDERGRHDDCGWMIGRALARRPSGTSPDVSQLRLSTDGEAAVAAVGGCMEFNMQ